eukprot:gene2997-4098_t
MLKARPKHSTNSRVKKIRCAIIGPGNIGTDLLYKLKRSSVLEPVWMVGVDPESEGLARAREYGLKTTADGVDGLLPFVASDNIQIAFDATSAYVHKQHSDALTALGVMMIDLTPAAIGPFCIPPINLKAHAGSRQMNVNMVTCGGQATIPMVYAVSRVQKVSYAEIVATVASKSIGPGTRKNIDEFTRTTAASLPRPADVDEVEPDRGVAHAHFAGAGRRQIDIAPQDDLGSAGPFDSRNACHVDLLCWRSYGERVSGCNLLPRAPTYPTFQNRQTLETPDAQLSQALYRRAVGRQRRRQAARLSPFNPYPLFLNISRL